MQEGLQHFYDDVLCYQWQPAANSYRIVTAVIVNPVLFKSRYNYSVPRDALAESGVEKSRGQQQMV